MSNNSTTVASLIPNPAAAPDTVGQQSRLISEPELEFFNSLHGVLYVELTTPAEPIGNTYNLSASPDTKLASVRLRTEVDDYDTDNYDTYESRDLTPEELDRVVIRGNRIRLRGLSGDVVSHDAANGAFFTVRELLAAVEETERQTRDRSEWFGGIDVHHCWFAGIYLEPDGVWFINWES